MKTKKKNDSVSRALLEERKKPSEFDSVQSVEELAACIHIWKKLRKKIEKIEFILDFSEKNKLSKNNKYLYIKGDQGELQSEYAWVTLVTTDNYVPGALVLLSTLRAHTKKTNYPMIALITENLSMVSVAILKRAGIHVIKVPYVLLFWYFISIFWVFEIWCYHHI